MWKISNPMTLYFAGHQLGPGRNSSWGQEDFFCFWGDISHSWGHFWLRFTGASASLINPKNPVWKILLFHSGSNQMTNLGSSRNFSCKHRMWGTLWPRRPLLVLGPYALYRINPIRTIVLICQVVRPLRPWRKVHSVGCSSVSPLL